LRTKLCSRQQQQQLWVLQKAHCFLLTHWAAAGPQLGHNWAAAGPQLGRNWAATGPQLGRNSLTLLSAVKPLSL
jgi:hypothetical protein